MSFGDSEWQSLGPLHAFDIGSVTAAKMDGDYGNRVDVAVVRTKAGCDVIVDRCPHQGVAFTDRGCLNANNQLVCTWHNWIFNLPNGTDTAEPGIQLQSVESQIQDGELWVKSNPDLF